MSTRIGSGKQGTVVQTKYSPDGKNDTTGRRGRQAQWRREEQDEDEDE